MSDQIPTPESIPYVLADHSRQLRWQNKKIEDLDTKTDQIPLINLKIDHLDRRMRGVTVALWGVAVAVVSAAITVLFAGPVG